MLEVASVSAAALRVRIPARFLHPGGLSSLSHAPGSARCFLPPRLPPDLRRATAGHPAGAGLAARRPRHRLDRELGAALPDDRALQVLHRPPRGQGPGLGAGEDHHPRRPGRLGPERADRALELRDPGDGRDGAAQLLRPGAARPRRRRLRQRPRGDGQDRGERLLDRNADRARRGRPGAARSRGQARRRLGGGAVGPKAGGAAAAELDRQPASARGDRGPDRRRPPPRLPRLQHQGGAGPGLRPGAGARGAGAGAGGLPVGRRQRWLLPGDGAGAGAEARRRRRRRLRGADPAQPARRLPGTEAAGRAADPDGRGRGLAGRAGRVHPPRHARRRGDEAGPVWRAAVRAAPDRAARARGVDVARQRPD